MKVPHEITLIAWEDNGDGTESIFHIFETSYRNASRFVRLWRRHSLHMCAIKTARPGGEFHKRYVSADPLFSSRHSTELKGVRTMKTHYETMLRIGNGVVYRVSKFDTRKEAVAAMKREKERSAYVVKVTREVTDQQKGKADPNRPIADTLNRVLST